MDYKYIGYACINETLSKHNIRANRNIKKSTLVSRGLPYISELIQCNLSDLLLILKWNTQNSIYNYRLPSEIFPWKTEYDIYDLPNFSKIEKQLVDIGDYILSNDIRVSFHPDHFCVLSSPKLDVVNNSIKELESSNTIFNLMNLPQTAKYKINIHIGGVYGDKIKAIDRFCHNYLTLSPSLKNRLTVENDDSINGYTVKDLYECVYKKIGTPIVFDYFHHTLNNDELSEKNALDLCISTWCNDIIPMVHYSSSKKIYETIDARNNAHANFIYDKIQTYGHNVAIMFETKSKEQAILKYKKEIVQQYGI